MKHSRGLKNTSNNVIVAVFAHPDDEAFGPSGTIAKLAKNNTVYLLCATKGEAGAKKGEKQIDNVREVELRNSAKILGVKKIYFLGFEDGTLSNSIYHKLAQEIEKKLILLKPSVLITFEIGGISGHIDHIVVSLATTYVFQKLAFVKQIYYFCITEKMQNEIKDYFIYVPPGYGENDIDHTEDIRGFWQTKLRSMLAHKSQAHDAKRLIEKYKKFPKEEHFLVLDKK